MEQKHFVAEALRRAGGYATLQQLYKTVDVSTWRTRTPPEAIRCVLQRHKEFFSLKPGLWALTEQREEVLRKLNLTQQDERSDNDFTHYYFQGLVVGIGNIKHFGTYVPPQDKNRLFLETPLGELATVQNIKSGDYKFTRDDLIRRAATVDAIWFNERRMPCAFYEVEHTTDIQHSLNKFYELQDFRARFCIVAAEGRRKQFNDVIASSIYNGIRGLVTFASYETIAKQYNQASTVVEVI